LRKDEKAKKTMESACTNSSNEAKKRLEESTWKIKLQESIKEFSKILEKVPPAERGFSAKSVREDRESH